MPLLLQITIFLGATLLLVPLGKRFGLATVLGYLLTGILLGPYVLKVERDPESIMQLAEYGVIMLMFLIGLELRPQRLWQLRQSIFVMGSLQLSISAVILLALAWAVFGLDFKASLIIGFGLALSSTAFVLQLLSEKKQLASTHGRQAFAILLFQDMAVIPLLALLPLLSGIHGPHHGVAHFAAVVATFSGLFLLSRYLIRPFFRFITKSGASELLTALALFIVLGVVQLMNLLDISTTLGAFLTGVLLADSEYRHELEASVQPFKGLLLGLFFITVGMSVQLDLLRDMPWLIMGCVLGLMVVKGLTLLLIGHFSGYRWSTSMRLGVSLAQGGEFAFVLFASATHYQIFPEHIAGSLTLIVTLSMILTPLAFLLLEKYGEPLFNRHQPSTRFDQIPDHQHAVIIAGFGRMGQIIGRLLRIHNIEFTAVDKNISQVDFVRKFGNAVYYGDPKNPEILRAAGIAHTKLFILTMDDVEDAISVAKYIRRNYPQVKILARARDRQHVYRLREAGVEPIWRETYLSALAMSYQALVDLGISPQKAHDDIEIFRDYEDSLLRRQQTIYNDEQQLIESNRAAMVELESLFDSDMLTAQRKMDVNLKHPVDGQH
ncbi:monovalent cation:proton antiporter-2 (CPA2) family protein [Alkanindiges sp. WGS2144]|uniref:monovalent cation:proton antiporter-2 (CPA2) family protein n=1 Tax=Alkanindiges sp. WGS2144 TaxID=3366808 RepID=UPI003751EF3E